MGTARSAAGFFLYARQKESPVPKINSGKEWSEKDLFDLNSCLQEVDDLAKKVHDPEVRRTLAGTARKLAVSLEQTQALLDEELVDFKRPA
jgi:hypothetical protein